VGRVGTGFTERERREITAQLRGMERKTPGASGERRMRHSVWRGWRPDKSPDDVVVEAPGQE
jgi:bifunctional non-homologous end joining protein LigD